MPRALADDGEPTRSNATPRSTASMRACMFRAKSRMRISVTSAIMPRPYCAAAPEICRSWVTSTRDPPRLAARVAVTSIDAWPRPFSSDPAASTTIRLAVSSRSLIWAVPANWSRTGPSLTATRPRYLLSPRSWVSSVPGRQAATAGMSSKNFHTLSTGWATSNPLLISISPPVPNYPLWMTPGSSSLHFDRRGAGDVVPLGQRLVHPARQQRHVDVADAGVLERVPPRVDIRRRTTDRGALADALRADRVVGAGRDDLIQLVTRGLPCGREQVVQVVRPDAVALCVKGDELHVGHGVRLGQPTHDLTFDDHGIDPDTTV